MDNKKKEYIKCGCSCEIVLLEEGFGNYDMFLSIYSFDGLDLSLWDRIKLAFNYIIKGREHILGDQVVLDKSTFIQKVNSFKDE